MDKECLLNDSQVQRFISDGYLLVHADFAEALHHGIYCVLEDVFEKEGNVGNNVLPRIPAIQEVYDHRRVRGALTSLLGPDYVMNPHRHCHLNRPGSAGQSWHKDCYVFDHNLRQPRFRWVLALYYPQDVSLDMGPTGILPQRHCYNEVSDVNADQAIEEALPLCGVAGTIALVNFDAWHRAMPNTSDKKRYMLKFQFSRQREPEEPSWNCNGTEWDPAPNEPDREVSRNVWRWLCGYPSQKDDNDGDRAIQSFNWLDEADEGRLLRAVYQLGPSNVDLVPVLEESLRQEASQKEAHIEDKTPANAHGTNPTALHSAQALLAIGPPAVPGLIGALIDEHWLVRVSAADALANLGPVASEAVDPLISCLGDEHWWVRRAAAEALGRFGSRASAAAAALVLRLADEDRRVRRMAAQALAQIGCNADGAVSALIRMLEDDDRYNRFYAGLALRRLDDRQGLDRLFDALSTARWCPLTSADSLY